jgi:queuine tRNA-ribosyltransferase
VRFEVMARSGLARLGRIETAHGVVDTPAFMPVGTAGTVKALHPDEVSGSGARMLIANTYHLWLRPGAELIAESGGLHRFMRWPHAIATDSGGFQAFSLAQRVKVDEDGFEFSSHIDGSRRRLTPEESMRVQGLLGSDIALQLDICPAAGVSRGELELAVERTTRWAQRCLAARRPDQALFGIVQGGLDVDLRQRHAEELGQMPLDGLALGGFSVGESPEAMYAALERVVPAMDSARPRYLMGVGTPADLVRAMAVGVDLFDCVLPTRNARNGQAFVSSGRLTLKNARFRSDPRPLDENCHCPVCVQGFSRAYLRHLYMAGEILGHRLLSLHNLHHYAALMASARTAILEGRFAHWLEVMSSATVPPDSAGNASGDAPGGSSVI